MNDEIAKRIENMRHAVGTMLVRIGARVCGKRLYQHSFYVGGKHPRQWTHEWTLTRHDLPKKKEESC